jgi:hypothetical protein
MGVHKKKDGARYNDGGYIYLYRGTMLLKCQMYTRREIRQKIIECWKKEIKNLYTTENYYLVINPNLNL